MESEKSQALVKLFMFIAIIGLWIIVLLKIE